MSYAAKWTGAANGIGIEADQAAEEQRESDAMEARIEAHLAAQAPAVQSWTSRNGFRHYTVAWADAPEIDVVKTRYTHPHGAHRQGRFVTNRYRYRVTTIIHAPLPSGDFVLVVYGTRISRKGYSFGSEIPIPTSYKNVESVA